jgi:hypothetical protein
MKRISKAEEWPCKLSPHGCEVYPKETNRRGKAWRIKGKTDLVRVLWTDVREPITYSARFIELDE